VSDALDALARRLYGCSRSEAQAAGVCINCKRKVNPVDLTPTDRKEYGLSALCPQCFAMLEKEEEE
jgi:hypothetical protein